MCYFRLIPKTKLLLKSLTVFFLIFLLVSPPKANCQGAKPDDRYWAKKLSDQEDKHNENFHLLRSVLEQLDSTASFNLLEQIDNASGSKNPYFIARYNCLKAKTLVRFNPPDPYYASNYSSVMKQAATQLLEEAMHQAYVTDDDYLTAFVSYQYGFYMKAFEYSSKAVMYLMYNIELCEKNQVQVHPDRYFSLGELLWKIREYKKCIEYTKKGISLVKPNSGDDQNLKMMGYNTLGLAYHRMADYDSAKYYYQEALSLASKITHTTFGEIWNGIIAANMAQIDFKFGNYKNALSAFGKDYHTNKKYEYYGDAANSLQWAAKTNLALKNETIALNQIKESILLLQKLPTAYTYRMNAYETASQIFKALDNSDSALYYSGKYSFLKDSLDRVFYQSSIDIAQLRLANEQYRYKTQNLERRKNDQIQKRNLIIGAIIFSSTLLLIIINGQRRKSKYQRDLEHSEKVRIEGEMAAARTQMEMFRKSIIEKSSVIERLQSQVKNKERTQQEQDLIASLANQTILTDEDWTKFKVVFEKIHPGIFSKIMGQFDGITQAELRMGALILLHLTTKQIAAVLGISPNSVIKTKQRLRQRFGLESAQEIEGFIATL